MLSWKLPMNLGTYEQLAMRTAKDFGSQRENINHAGLGCVSDAGEFASLVKRHVVYGAALDSVLVIDGVAKTLQEHMVEELGDTLWFIALAARSLGVSLDEIARQNIDKLRIRYPWKYSDEDALARKDKA